MLGIGIEGFDVVMLFFGENCVEGEGWFVWIGYFCEDYEAIVW